MDVAPSALEVAAGRAEAAGVGDRVTWEQHDLPRSFPDGAFDLVSVQFLHSPVAVPGERAETLALAARAAAPGGVLLIVSHAGWPSWVGEPPFEYRFDTTRDVLDALRLEPGCWDIEREELIEREATAPDGGSGRRADHVVHVRRRQRPPP